MGTLESVADCQSIETRLSALISSDRRRWGKMSAHEMICHLCDSYQLPLAERTASSATGFLQRTLVKWVALSLPVPWLKGISIRPETAGDRGILHSSSVDQEPTAPRLAALDSQQPPQPSYLILKPLLGLPGGSFFSC
jgi:hypothetical protein